jgi:hypothetical protein
MTTPPSYRKVNPADQPVLAEALTKTWHKRRNGGLWKRCS